LGEGIGKKKEKEGKSTLVVNVHLTGWMPDQVRHDGQRNDGEGSGGVG